MKNVTEEKLLELVKKDPTKWRKDSNNLIFTYNNTPLNISYSTTAKVSTVNYIDEEEFLSYDIFWRIYHLIVSDTLVNFIDKELE